MKFIRYRYRKIQALLLVCLGIVILFSCKDDDDVRSSVFGVSEEESEFLVQDHGDTYTVNLTADGEWYAESSAEWCMVTPANGSTSTVCELRVDTSYLYKERKAVITFVSGARSSQIKVTQLGFEKVIELEKDEIEVADFIEYGKMFSELKVISNVKYEIIPVDENQKWVRVSKEEKKVGSVPRPDKVRFDFDIYTQSDADREAQFIFRQTDAKEGEKPIEKTFTFRQTKTERIVPSRRGDSLALLAISRVMKCYTQWDESQPMIYWNNVKTEEVDYKYVDGDFVRDTTELRVVGVNFYIFNTNNSIPYQIRFLSQLRTLIFTGNENSYLKSIKLEDDVTYLDSLESLAFIGYGINSLPARMTNLKKLKELELSGNPLQEFPMDIIEALDKDSLLYVSLSNCRHYEIGSNLAANNKDSIGLGGELPERLFRLKRVAYLHLSYNYFEGSIPAMEGESEVMPQLRALSLNLNYLSGMIPEWILKHKRLKCWDPYTMVFNQTYNGKDSKNRRVGFENEPDYIDTPCPDWEESTNKTALTPSSFDSTFKWFHYFNIDKKQYPVLSLDGNWGEIED